jgi:hypothetical protein
MSHRTTVREAWAIYRSRVIPSSAGSVQIQECRRAFYAGAESLMVAIMDGLDPSRDPTEGDEAYLNALHQELLVFAIDVKEGRA